jgi:hypothetical protein
LRSQRHSKTISRKQRDLLKPLFCSAWQPIKQIAQQKVSQSNTISLII